LSMRYSPLLPPSAPLLSTLCAAPAISDLSLHDALPISRRAGGHCRWGEGSRKGHGTSDAQVQGPGGRSGSPACRPPGPKTWASRSEEHTSELQSHLNLVCRLLLAKKKSPTTSGRPGRLC